jgi:hypothetical protein
MPLLPELVLIFLPWGVCAGGWVWFVNSGREHLVAIREVKVALAGGACASLVVWCVVGGVVLGLVC